MICDTKFMLLLFWSHTQSKSNHFSNAFLVYPILFWQSTVGQISQEPRRKYWATRSSIHSFARTALLFACSAPLASLARSTALTCLLACSLRSLCSFPRSWESNWLDGYFVCVFFSVLGHSAVAARRKNNDEGGEAEKKPFQFFFPSPNDDLRLTSDKSYPNDKHFFLFFFSRHDTKTRTSERDRNGVKCGWGLCGRSNSVWDYGLIGGAQTNMGPTAFRARQNISL